MSHIFRAPRTRLSFHPKETKATVAFSIYITTVDHESLSDGRFHFRNCTGSFSVDICTDAITAMHDKGAFIHSLLRRCDKVEIVYSA